MKATVAIFIFLALSFTCIKSQTISIHNLGCKVNSKDVDYAPIISPDGLKLYFVSVRNGSKLNSNGEQSHDFWTVEKRDKYDTLFFTPINLDTTNSDNGINTSQNEGTASFSPDGKTIYFTACDKINGYGSCDIFYSKWSESGWSKPLNLGSGVNTPNWESQPSISPDGTRLFFVSNRPGPNGDDNMDIWYSVWDDQIDEWLPAQNLTQLNSSKTESSPFIASDNVTLFFSSDGHKPNYGGLDFYISRFAPEYDFWSEPANLGQPLNSNQDDQFLSLPATGDIIYFTSKRNDLGNSCGNLDLYMAFVPSYYKAIVLNVSVADDFTGEPIYSKVTIINPITGRKIDDRTFPGKDKVEMIISQTDFGKEKDSVRFVDFEITADNSKYGKTKKILRVENPQHKDFNDLRDFTDKIGVTLEYDTDSKNKNPREESDFSIVTAKTNIWGVDGKILFPLDTLIIDQVTSTNMYPLLNYVFFDDNSSELPERYVRLKEKFAYEFNLSMLNNKDVLFTYRNLLNIVGKRMNEKSLAKITILGCNSNIDKEKGNTSLSESRANTIKKYLQEVWKIEDERISVKSRNLPEKASNNGDKDGIEENRRVELSSNDEYILSPIFVSDTSFNSIPPTVRFKDAAKVKFGETFWKISLKQNNEVLKEFIGEGNSETDLDWNINDEKSFPSSELPIYCETEVNDKEIRKTIVSKDTIPVKFLTLELKERNKLQSRSIEKFNLILFDFGSNKLGPGNLKISTLIKSKIRDNSKVYINGYTDRLGNDNFNLNLSKGRAKSVYQQLGFKNALFNGIGESQLLYNNDLPEGRFYCRTVTVTVDNPYQSP